jgi:hypothetical protein
LQRVNPPYQECSFALSSPMAPLPFLPSPSRRSPLRQAFIFHPLIHAVKLSHTKS